MNKQERQQAEHQRQKEDKVVSNSSNEKRAHNPSLEKHTSPFDKFGISSSEVLDGLGREPCPQCKKPSKFYCSFCLVPVGCSWDAFPRVTLPIRMDVIKHENERHGKSTALHAKLLAPNQVDVYEWRQMPAYEDTDRLLLLFPGPGAKRLEDIDPNSFDKLVVIDGTWQQANQMWKDENGPLKKMRLVTIEPQKTLFWRYQMKQGDDHLATIEAIYYFFKEYHIAYRSAPPTAPSLHASDIINSSKSAKDDNSNNHSRNEPTIRFAQGVPTSLLDTTNNSVVEQAIKYGPYTNQYDDLLWFYKYFYEMIQRIYRTRTDGKTFTKKHKKNYIQA